MRKGWEEKKFVDIFTIKPQKREALKQLKKDDPISFVPMNCLNVQEKQLTLSHTKTLGDAYKGYTYFADNDVLLAKITPCFENGKVGIAKNLVNGIGFGSSEYIVFRSNGEVIPEYLFYYISQESFRNEGKKRMAGAVGHKRVSKEFIENYYLCYPESIPEQKRIVKILDKAFAATQKAKENTEKNLQNSKELFDSYLQSVFANPGKDWEEKKLGEIGITQTGTTPKTSDKNNYGDFIPFIKPADVAFKNNGEIRYDNIGLSEQGLKNGRKMLKGSVLMVCIGATIGKVGFVDRDVSCNQQINSLTVKNGSHPKFIYYALSTREFFEQVLHNAAQATLPIINKGKWETLKISFPKSTSEQKHIIIKLDTLSAETKKLELIYQQKLVDLEELKKSILLKAFEGEL